MHPFRGGAPFLVLTGGGCAMYGIPDLSCVREGAGKKCEDHTYWGGGKKTLQFCFTFPFPVPRYPVT